MNASRGALLLLALACCSRSPSGQASPRGDILAELKKVPGVVEVREDAGEPGTRFFVVRFEQPVDHRQPEGQKFTERLTLRFRSYDAPMVFWTTGYEIPVSAAKVTEPTRVLDANQILLEHRFFDESAPEPKDWKYLDIYQMATDQHRIVEAFRPLFAKKWLTTGVSKGGMTAVYHRYFYPNDVYASIPYSAPSNEAKADPHYAEFMEGVGDAECRGKLKAFEAEVLRRRPEFESRFLAEAAAQGQSYERLGIHYALDDTVLWASFTLWSANRGVNGLLPEMSS